MFFSFFRKPQIFHQKFLILLIEKDISVEEFLLFVSHYKIKNPYALVNNNLNGFLFGDFGSKEEYFSYLKGRFDITEKYAPGRLENTLSYNFNILNPLISSGEIDKACSFFISEGGKDPFELINRYGYTIFFRGGKIDKVVEKYNLIKDHPYLKGKLKDPLIFTLESTSFASVKTIMNELDIYHECDAIDIFLSEVNRFGIISKGEEKLRIFEELGFRRAERNVYLGKHFVHIMTYKMTPKDLRTILLQSK